MAKRTFLAGATSQTIDIFIQDSSSITGAGLAGLAFNSSGLKCYYRKGATGAATAISPLVTQTATGAWTSAGFVEIDATNMKGLYRFDIPDTVLASSPYAMLYFYGATNMAPVVAELEITAYDPFNATSLGLSRLDAAVTSRAPSTLTTTAMTESYAAFHAAPTMEQIMFEIRARLCEFSVTGVTGTAKKINGSTTAETFTLDDATSPTAITRAS